LERGFDPNASQGTYCNNCGWKNGDPLRACNDTLAHEFAHTVDLHSQILYPKIKDVADTFDNPIERPAGERFRRISLEFTLYFYSNAYVRGHCFIPNINRT
jgi:hypothetical protein